MTRLDWLKKIEAVPNKHRIDLIADIIDVLYFDTTTGTYDPDKEWSSDSIRDVAAALSLCDLTNQVDYLVRVERTSTHQVKVSHWSKEEAASLAETLPDEDIVEGELGVRPTCRAIAVEEAE